MKSNPPLTLGLIDWGIGGLSVYKEIQKQLKVSCVYFSDSGFTPYGKTPKQKLIKRLNLILDFFRQKNIKHIIIACNAASTVLDELQLLNPDLKLEGMLHAGIQTIRSSRKKKILILGGKRTIKSQFFQNYFSQLPHSQLKIDVEALIAQPLSALIEKGEHPTPKFLVALKKIIKKASPSPGLVLLACTHYPAATETFKTVFPESLIADPAIVLVKKLNLKNRQRLRNKNLHSTFYTTGSNKQSEIAAYKAFNFKINKFIKVKITE